MAHRPDIQSRAKYQRITSYTITNANTNKYDSLFVILILLPEITWWMRSAITYLSISSAINRKVFC